MLRDVGPQEAFDLIMLNRNNFNFIILDVRTPAEFNEGHLEGSILMDYYSIDFKEELDKLDRDNFYLIYCRTGNRSKKTLDLMNSLGFRGACNLLGGFTRWKKMGLPMVTP